jgi:hypothetical protein
MHSAVCHAENPVTVAGRRSYNPMRLSLPIRGQLLLVPLCGMLTVLPANAQRGHKGSAPAPRAEAPHAQAPRAEQPQASRPAPIVRNENANNPAGAHAPKGEHLAEWMNQHSNLTPDQQQRALENEPGFRELPQATQQRMHDRLSQLNAMTPAQRDHLLARNEAMEHLTPDQRSQVRGVMQQLGSLPPDQRRVVARSFRELRDLPPDQRIAAMNSDRYRSQLNDAQRNTLTNLIRIEPMLPPPDK